MTAKAPDELTRELLTVFLPHGVPQPHAVSQPTVLRELQLTTYVRVSSDSHLDVCTVVPYERIAQLWRGGQRGKAEVGHNCGGRDDHCRYRHARGVRILHRGRDSDYWTPPGRRGDRRTRPHRVDHDHSG